MPDAVVDNRGAAAPAGPPGGGAPGGGPPAAQPSGGAGPSAAPGPVTPGTTGAVPAGQTPITRVGVPTGRGVNEPFYQQRYQEEKAQREADRREIEALKAQVGQVTQALQGLRPPSPAAPPAPAAGASPGGGYRVLTPDTRKGMELDGIATKYQQMLDNGANPLAAEEFKHQALEEHRRFWDGQTSGAGDHASLAPPQPAPAPTAAAPPISAPPVTSVPLDQVAELVDARMRMADREGRLFEMRLSQAGRELEKVKPGIMSESVKFADDSPYVPETLRGLELPREDAVKFYAQETGVTDINWILRNADPAGWDSYQRALGAQEATQQFRKNAAQVPLPGGTVPAMPSGPIGVQLPPAIAASKDALVADANMSNTKPEGFNPVR